MRNIVAVGVLLLLGAGPVHASDWGNPSMEWNGHLRFDSPSEEQVRLNRADMIERERGGYYGQWSTTTINNSYGNTIIENMNSSTAIGSQTVTEIKVNGDNNNVEQHSESRATSNGNTSAGIAAPSDSYDRYYNN